MLEPFDTPSSLGEETTSPSALDGASNASNEHIVSTPSVPAESDETDAVFCPPPAPVLVGRIGSPPRLEATSDEFHFWASRGHIVEKTQLVQTQSHFDGLPHPVTFYGVVQEVKRVSRKNDMGQEFDLRDGQAGREREQKPEGITFATVSILRANCTMPDGENRNVLTPPLEESEVLLGGAQTAEWAYGFNEMNRPLAIGRLKNGASDFAGTGKIDLYYLLGQYAGHMNVSGMTGLGAKSTFLMTFLKMILHEAENPDAEPLHVAPIIFNVKGHDLMWIDRPNTHFNPVQHGAKWQALGLPPDPGAFAGTRFFSSQDVPGCHVTRFSWSLRDILSKGLFRFLFEDSGASDLMFGCIQAIVGFLTEADGTTLIQGNDRPQTWAAFRTWLRGECEGVTSQLNGHTTGTKWGVLRRLEDTLIDGGELFPSGQEGLPLTIRAAVEHQVASVEVMAPRVIDISSLSSSLKRFVVAAVVKDVFGNTNTHLSYLLMLDELNRFAPREARDGITKLLEEVALEGRSRGVILLGAQQFASQVSGKIIESAAIRVAGACGAAEMEDRVWRSWNATVRQQATGLRLDEKLVMQPTFRGPMLVQMPHPAWAMRHGEIAVSPVEDTPEI